MTRIASMTQSRSIAELAACFQQRERVGCRQSVGLLQAQLGLETTGGEDIGHPVCPCSPPPPSYEGSGLPSSAHGFADSPVAYSGIPTGNQPQNLTRTKACVVILRRWKALTLARFFEGLRVRRKLPVDLNLEGILSAGQYCLFATEQGTARTEHAHLDPLAGG